MNTKRFGYIAVRWFVWLLLAWVLVRGLASFLPESATTAATASARPAAEASIPQQALALRFASEYLSWQPGDGEERNRRLDALTTPNLTMHLDIRDAPAGQTVEATWVHSVKSVSPTRWLVTVVAVVSTPAEAEPRTLYLAVPVGRTAEGGWVVYDYPTLVPPPPAGTFAEPLHYGTEVPDQDDEIRGLLDRFFAAYLTADQADLAYLLAPEATVRAFRSPWTFDSISDLILSQTDSGLYALTEVILRDPATGVRYTNRYTVALAQRDGRWYIAEILQEGE